MDVPDEWQEDGDVEQSAGEMRARRLAPTLIALVLCAAAAGSLVPRGFAAQAQLGIKDDPAAIADRALDGIFDSTVANREIVSALAANDPDLAQSFVDLAAARQVAVDPALATKVQAAVAEAASARGKAVSFVRGFVTGVPTDGAALAGTAAGDLFVFGDLRDLTREGIHAARGQTVDKAVVGLAALGVAITAGTYATLGVMAPMRAGLTLVKAALRTGRMSVDLGIALGRMLRHALVGSESAVALRVGRETVKGERAAGLLRFVGDVGRIESRAGTRAALDSLKIAQSPAEVARLAKLAEKNGSRTRAILKLLGRGAIMIAAATADLATWMIGALLSALALMSALKGMVERITWRVLRHRKALRQRRLGHHDETGGFGTVKIAAAIWRALRSHKGGVTPSHIALAPSGR